MTFGTKCFLAAAVTVSLVAVQPAEGGKFVKPGDYNTEHRTVKLFEAKKSGEITVQLIMGSSKKGTIFVRNNTKDPLNVEAPTAFVGLPIEGKKREKLGAVDQPSRVRLPGLFGGQPALAQAFGQGGLGAQGGLGGGLGGGTQGIGGGLGGAQGIGGNQGQVGGANLFNVGPGEVARVRIPAVCLEHGKDEPSPRVYYEMAPMESVVKDPAIYELCTMLGNGEVDQRVAQAATWHLANGMTWQQLAAKRVRHLNGSISSFFTRAEVLTAVKAVRVAQYRAKLRAKQSESQTSYKEGGE